MQMAAPLPLPEYYDTNYISLADLCHVIYSASLIEMVILAMQHTKSVILLVLQWG